MYGISRIDDPTHRTHAWRVSLRRRGAALVKNFPDIKYGSKKKALDAARQHRDRMVTQYPPLSRIEFANAPRRNNKSGVTGVCLVACKYYLKDGTERCLWYWEASWPTTPGNHINQRFSCQIYGKEKAFEMACRARRKGLRAVDGIFWATERRAPADAFAARAEAPRQITRTARPTKKAAAVKKAVKKAVKSAAKKPATKTVAKRAPKKAARKIVGKTATRARARPASRAARGR